MTFYAIEAFFDPATDAAIRAVSRVLPMTTSLRGHADG